MQQRRKKTDGDIERLIANIGLHGVLELIAVALERHDQQLLADQTRRLAFKVEKVLLK